MSTLRIIRRAGSLLNGRFGTSKIHRDAQQRNAKGDPLDRAYLSFDNETGRQVYDAKTRRRETFGSLEEAGRREEKAELLADFRAHADYFVKVGPNYPTSEVNYEQAIVAPAVQLRAEIFLGTNDKSYWDRAKRQMPLLEAFCAKRPTFGSTR